MLIGWNKYIFNIINTKYNNLYSLFNYDGIRYEIISKTKSLGLIIVIIILIGLIYSLVNKKNSKYTITFLSNYLLTIFLFTTIQTIDIHHNLVLSYFFYFYCVYNLIIIKFKNNKLTIFKNILFFIISISCLF